MLYMQSTSSADGGYSLTITFALGTDPDINTVNVHNRVSLAEPLLPDEVSPQGLTVQTQSSGQLQVVQLYTPNGTYDHVYPHLSHDHCYSHTHAHTRCGR